MSTVTAETLNFLGTRVRIVAGGDDTGEALGLVEMIDLAAGGMPPLHVHHTHDESFYVLEGSVTVLLPGREIELGPGDMAFGPRGVPHAYRVGDESARVLVASTPAGFERFVAAVAAGDQSGPGKLAAVAAEHDIEILGPPGTLP